MILRHRVTHYRAGDLDRSYRPLKLEEDYLLSLIHIWSVPLER